MTEITILSIWFYMENGKSFSSIAYKTKDGIIHNIKGPELNKITSKSVVKKIINNVKCDKNIFNNEIIIKYGNDVKEYKCVR